ncbi:GNAT family N-acetyltransferase [Vibrio sp. SS-MA-C1-2]|uniref:GNAT family N-acetyltransferase n=1 Tax=Vibrio sp. SS-MA-C1-2 TaxID=2908646 RepID=UPI001F317AE5|nr:GNAT family N-acetyltransferase [Vibrio sp. SS-MA-C1-2]UJF19557.1 GNAT family N-acetyltransferase [Vibrio sp. SS-MA-C1-2]
MISWQTATFNQLDINALYEIMKLRSEVFVVEQNCVYLDMDDKDRVEGVYHLMGYVDDKLVAYMRLLPKGVSFADSVSLGRVLVCPTARKDGYGHQLLIKGLALAEELWPQQSIEIGAQQYLMDFYQSHGFVITSDMYLEDGIPHLDMIISKG